MLLHASVFQYSQYHNVNEVDKEGYSNCNASNAILTSSNGNTSVTLTTTGENAIAAAVATTVSFGAIAAVSFAAIVAVSFAAVAAVSIAAVSFTAVVAVSFIAIAAVSFAAVAEVLSKDSFNFALKSVVREHSRRFISSGKWLFAWLKKIISSKIWTKIFREEKGVRVKGGRGSRFSDENLEILDIAPIDRTFEAGRMKILPEISDGISTETSVTFETIMTVFIHKLDDAERPQSSVLVKNTIADPQCRAQHSLFSVVSLTYEPEGMNEENNIRALEKLTHTQPS
ncbi:hypothetical protein IEQ34_013996 [Dendrobium chrysotoxum]|uniref:Phytocyanin domain-containing protein n=1 Tax=Dendrobium chrysotoxum TaxID=161865 RepID=A0AAV7G2N3_DENCH|nr:hypothetical protein IEQ34_013996 [Dendrobium chrysotoxum]